jgi:hypothetical protein
MIKVNFNTSNFAKEMNSIIAYSNGFLDGAKTGKQELLITVGEKTKEFLNQYIDSNARANEAVLNHVYEWSQSGSANARLFEIEYVATGAGLTFKSTFSQSSSIRDGSNVPFYDKARIMEQGIPVTIRPKRSDVLVFEQDGEQVFTKSPIRNPNPGGGQTTGGFQETVDSFFNSYWRQSFLKTSGIADIINNTVGFKQNLPRAKAGGRSKGFDVGYRWIAAKAAR